MAPPAGGAVPEPGEATEDVTLRSGTHPRTVGQYRLLELIGTGAMGEVYRAQHTQLGRSVALKLLRPELTDRPGAAQRLFAEARAANLVRSDHIVEVTDLCFADSGDVYLVMELLEGRDLADARAAGALDLAGALDVMRQLTETMAQVHRAGIVHRDLKPENVFLTQRDGGVFVKLIDFGVAKLKDEHGRSMTATSPGLMVGTPRYMAPEQVATDPVDGRCDVYSIGVMLYELLTGEVPFASATFREQLIDTLRKVPEPVSARVALPAVMREAADSLVADCLQKDPSRRPDAEELLRRLEDLQARLQEGRNGVSRLPLPLAQAEQEGHPTRVWRRPGDRRRLAAVTSLVGLLVAAGISLAWAADTGHLRTFTTGLARQMETVEAEVATAEPSPETAAQGSKLPLTLKVESSPRPPEPTGGRARAPSTRRESQNATASSEADVEELDVEDTERRSDAPHEDANPARNDEREALDHRGRAGRDDADEDEQDARRRERRQERRRRARERRAAREAANTGRLNAGGDVEGPVTLEIGPGGGVRDAVMNPFVER